MYKSTFTKTVLLLINWWAAISGHSHPQLTFRHRMMPSDRTARTTSGDVCMTLDNTVEKAGPVYQWLQ